MPIKNRIKTCSHIIDIDLLVHQSLPINKVAGQFDTIVGKLNNPCPKLFWDTQMKREEEYGNIVDD
jgi:hypothetical protein